MLGELYVGLDVHKLTTVATILDTEGHRVDQAKFSSADTALVEYLNPVLRHLPIENLR